MSRTLSKPSSAPWAELCLALLLLATPAFGFQCPPGHSLETVFAEAEQVFLIYVLETRLEEGLVTEYLPEGPEGQGGEDIKLVAADFRLIEHFKGPEDLPDRLLDVLGIGTGYVGLTPGVYYLVLLPPKDEEENPNLRWVSHCTVLASHHKLFAEPFQAQLEIVRSLAKAAEDRADDGPGRPNNAYIRP